MKLTALVWFGFYERLLSSHNFELDFLTIAETQKNWKYQSETAVYICSIYYTTSVLAIRKY